MITPAYAATATERVLPRLALDFTTGVLDPRVTVTRALNTATRVNSSGLIEVVNADLPRFDYDPATLAPKGLLIEETRANLLLHSSGANESAWTKDAAGTGVAPVVTPNFAVAPDGTTTADRVQFDRGAGTTVNDVSRLFQFVGGTDTRTASVYLKSNDSNTYTLQLLTGSNVQAISVTPSGFTRFTVSGATGSNFILRLVGSVGASATADIIFWGSQLEAGAFATSYIPTTTTSLTRNADVVSMTGTNFSDWYNASEGTFAASVLISAKTPSSYGVYSADDGTTNNAFPCFYSAGILANARVGGAGVFTSFGSLAVGAPTKVAFGYENANYASAFNGAVPTTQASGAIPSGLNRLQLGAYNNFYLNGHFQSLRYWPLALTAAEIRANSKG